MSGKFKDRHFNMGSILLASGVVIAIEGCLNTWSRTGKLFPGPHLFAGASIVALWALAAAMVPAMQKGNESARNAHIALNAANVSLFIWQIPTGCAHMLYCMAWCPCKHSCTCHHLVSNGLASQSLSPNRKPDIRN